MGFAYKDNSHEILSEQNIRKSLKEQQQQTSTKEKLPTGEIETTTTTSEIITLADDQFASGASGLRDVNTQALQTAINSINTFIQQNPGGTYVVNIAGMESQVPNQAAFSEIGSLARARAATVEEFIKAGVTQGVPITYNSTGVQGDTAYDKGAGDTPGDDKFTQQQKVDVNISLADVEKDTFLPLTNFYIETVKGKEGKDGKYYIPARPKEIWGPGKHNTKKDFDLATAQALANKNITDRKVIVGPAPENKDKQAYNFFGLNKPYVEVKGYRTMTDDQHNKGIVKFWFDGFDKWNNEKGGLSNYIILTGEEANQANTKGAASFGTGRTPALPGDPETTHGVRSSAPLN